MAPNHVPTTYGYKLATCYKIASSKEGHLTTPRQRFAEVLKASTLTQKDFGKMIGIAGPTVSQIVDGHRELTLDVARGIAAAYGYRLGWLLEGELPKRRRSNDPLAEAREAGFRDGLRTAREAVAAIELARDRDPNDSRHEDRPSESEPGSLERAKARREQVRGLPQPQTPPDQQKEQP